MFNSKSAPTGMSMMLKQVLGVDVSELTQQVQGVLTGLQQVATSIDTRLGIIIQQNNEILRKLSAQESLPEVKQLERTNSSSETRTD